MTPLPLLVLQALSLIFFTPFYAGLFAGAGIIVAQYFGAGKKKPAVGNIQLSACYGYIRHCNKPLSVPAAKPILELLNVPDKLIGDSAVYMQIACGGTIAVAAYNWINAMA